MTVALALLAGGYFIWRAVSVKGDGSGSDTAPGDDTYTVGTVDTKTLTAVSVSRRTEPKEEGGETGTVSFEFRLKEDETGWLWSENEKVPLSNEKFAEMATAVSSVTSPYKLDGVSAADLGKYGLDEPEVSLAFTDGAGTHRFYIGSLNSYTGTNYFCTDDKSVVYTVDPSVAESFRFDIYDVIDTDDAPAVNASALTSLEYTANGKKLLFTYYSGGKESDYTSKYNWYFSVDGGAESHLAAEIGEALTKALTSLDLGKCVAYDSSRDSEFGLDKASRLVLKYNKTSTVTDSTTNIDKTVTTPEEFVLNVGKNEDGVIYVRADGSSLTARLSSQDAFAAVMTENVRSLRPTELLLPDYGRIDGITFSAGGKTLAVKVVHADDGGISYESADGKTLDEDKLTKLLDALAAAKTSAFASDLERDPAAGSDAVFTAEFTFNTGDAKTGTLTVSNYSGSYCIVSFMNNNDRLMTIDEAKTLTEALEACLG